MKIDPRELQPTHVRHLKLKDLPPGDYVVRWYGAVIKNKATVSLPHVAVWFQKLDVDGTLSDHRRIDVGITDLGLLQIGTIWNQNGCNRQIRFEEHTFQVNFSREGWEIASQYDLSHSREELFIPSKIYPLNWASYDRSQLLVFELRNGRKLIVPCLEFYSRYYGRSGHVRRVLATYGWEQAEPKLYLPFEGSAPPGSWPINLASNTRNSDAVFLAHVKYDSDTRHAAKSVYAGLETQYDDKRLGGKAFPKISPWFKGNAELIVQGHWLDDDRFLALRIAGGSYPQGPHIIAYRENPGKADESAPDGAPFSGWRGGRNLPPPPVFNVTSDDEPDHSSDTADIEDSTFRISGPPRKVDFIKSSKAVTRPAKSTPKEQSEQYSPGERYGSRRGTGVASIHTETILESNGVARDVWEALLHLRETMPNQVIAVGWYSADTKQVNFSAEPSMAALWQFSEDEANAHKLKPAHQRWVYLNDEKLRGVLVSFVRTTTGSAYLFEIERRQRTRTSDEGQEFSDEEALCGLVVSTPSSIHPGAWIPRVLDGIRLARGVMKRVLKYCPQDQTLAHYYRHPTSSTDQISGHSTVINALGKVGIEIPRPKQ